MNKISKNEKGFTVVEGLLIVLVLAVIGFGGYYVWHTQHKTKPVAVTTSSSTKPATTAKTTTTAPTSTTKYLQVTQLGVELPLATGIDDLIYNYIPNDDTDSTPGSTLTFSTTSLDNISSACEPSTTQDVASGFGIVYVKTSPLPASDVSTTGSPNDEQVVLYSHVNGYYLYWQSSTSGCDTNSQGVVNQSAQTLFNQQLPLFQAALKNAQAIN
ncbi:MAG: hypothetical protein WDN66_03750 [Candidatus Saccharibacteria bacterium]